MEKYRGCYIDNVYFHNEKEVDEFLKNKAVESYIMLIQLFTEKPQFEYAAMVEKQAENLVKNFGFDWEQIEELEARALQTA